MIKKSKRNRDLCAAPQVRSGFRSWISQRRATVETQRTSRKCCRNSFEKGLDIGWTTHSRILIQWRTIFRGWTFQPDVGRMAKPFEAREFVDTSASEFAKSKFHPPTGHTHADRPGNGSVHRSSPAIWSINKNWLNAIILVLRLIRITCNLSSQLEKKTMLVAFFTKTRLWKGKWEINFVINLKLFIPFFF